MGRPPYARGSQLSLWKERPAKGGGGRAWRRREEYQRVAGEGLPRQGTFEAGLLDWLDQPA